MMTSQMICGNCNKWTLHKWIDVQAQECTVCKTRPATFIGKNDIRPQHPFFDRKQSDGDIKAIRQWDWYSLKNGEIRAVVTEFDETESSTVDIRYRYSVAFYGQSPSPNYRHWNGAFAWCVDLDEMEQFLKDVAALRVKYKVQP